MRAHCAWHCGVAENVDSSAILSYFCTSGDVAVLAVGGIELHEMGAAHKQ